MSLRRAARVILVGAPGVGKGTQSDRLLTRFAQLQSISSGDLLRQNVKNKTPLVRIRIKVENVMKAGGLVSDDLILRLISNEFFKRGWLKGQGPPQLMTLASTSTAGPESLDGSPAQDVVDSILKSPLQPDEAHLLPEASDSPSASFILDGFPRTAAQAEMLDKIIPINLVVSITTPFDVILERISGRWVHEPSGRVYNTTFNAPRSPGIDDVTGEPLVQRPDDSEEVYRASWGDLFDRGDQSPGYGAGTGGGIEAVSDRMLAEGGSRGDDLEGHLSGSEKLDCVVSSPIKENDGTKDAFVSYLITTQAIPQQRFRSVCGSPIPDKQRMEYVRGDRFGPDFTARRAHSLQRFLARLALHPVLRRSSILHTFLESPEWNATMRSRSTRASTSSDHGSGGVFDNFADTFINAFTKIHKPDKRFIEVKEKSDKLDEDLSHVEKVMARVTRREADLETDFKDLAEQFQRLISLEPGVETPLRAFSNSVEDTSAGLKKLKDVTDQGYLGSLRDMQAYDQALKNLLKAREQKQLDFEQLTEYLNKSTAERDALQSGSHYYSATGGITAGASGFIRSKIEDVRGIEELTREVEEARNMSEMFDEEVVREVSDFERIKRIELKKEFRTLADAHIDFYGDSIEIWDKYIEDMEKEGRALPP
ncbi:unnamed protein product [Parascedosporium putredinis]|uniref:Sorting nexin-4 n=1 Tax=Parascedosporium putredinis TaxID=1442378 RepID=A0A9P1HB36_9PEZI|nr:unnamed protein product [Parascedosporium putredinis]CAI8003475.1 unnamed protein product [Parascedosporium putredinis]